MSRTKVIAFANNKGGSGKTTSCSNIGYALSAMGKKVLLIDGDMQLNLTLSYFDEERALDFASNGKNIYTAIKEEKDLSDFIVPTDYKDLDIIPSTSLMSSIEFDLFPKWQREFILRKCLDAIKARGYYDYILIDTPPCLVVTDALLYKDYITGYIAVIRAGATRADSTAKLLERIKQIGGRMIGFILNDRIGKTGEYKHYSRYEKSNYSND